MLFLWSLSDRMSPQDSRIFLSALADLINAMVWVVAILLPITNCLCFLKYYEIFSHQRKLMVFHWRLSYSKFLGLFSVGWSFSIMLVSTRPPTSKSSRPFNNPLVTVPKAPITIGIIVTLNIIIIIIIIITTICRSSSSSISIFTYLYRKHSKSQHALKGNTWSFKKMYRISWEIEEKMSTDPQRC